KWSENPFNNRSVDLKKKHWTEWSDFDENIGDIKVLWEPSRFNWLLDLSRAYRVTGENKYLNTINEWLNDWSFHNPKNIGPNWKCGQEAGIRLMKLLTAAEVLDQSSLPSKGLISWIADHLERIHPNIRYAIAQDNNHGTTEAAALYIGAAWLLQADPNNFQNSRWIRWKKQGRAVLEERIKHLIEEQGSFSQKSVNYHRVVVDTMGWVLFNMKRLDEKPFEFEILQRIRSLALWQFKMIVGSNGETPNIGSNDGAMLEILHSSDYRDFRPSTQLIFGLLDGVRVFDAGPWDEPLYWYIPEVFKGTLFNPPTYPNCELLDRQYLILRNNRAVTIVVLPNDKFRPNSCDAFHLDLWVDGKNWLSDQGTYSYNAGEQTDAFKSVQFHNTVQYGLLEQMPKISRFLYGNWLNTESSIIKEKEIGTNIWEGSYTVKGKYKHTRRVTLLDNGVEVLDSINATSNELMHLRWHSEYDLTRRIHVIDSCKSPISPKKLSGQNSNYYLEKHEINVYQFSTSTRELTTSIKWE
ncbi:MAG: hypothetical protein EBX50_20050, partial [Chitinophagia bacterium]|nr:hypothetical protein [Chitinophagia bacterium]